MRERRRGSGLGNLAHTQALLPATQRMEAPMSDKHDKALDLTEQALDALEKDDEPKADKLLEEAKKLDPSSVEEVVEDLGDAEDKA